MKTFMLLNCLLFWILQHQVIAQGVDAGSRSKFLDLGLGYKITSILDRNTSHLVYASNNPLLKVRLTGIHSHGLVRGQITAGRGQLFSRDFPNRTITFSEEDVHDQIKNVEVPMRGNLSFLRCSMEYLRKVQTSGNFVTYVGGRLQEEVNFSQGFVTPGLMNSFSLAPSLETQFTGQQSFFSIGISIPLIAFITRSAYHNSVSLPEIKRFNGFWKNGTSFQSISDHREINIYARYFQSINKRLSGGIEYNFSSLRNKIPRDLSKVDHEFNITLRIIK